MKSELGRLVTRTSLITFCVVFITASYGAAFLGLLFPHTMSNFCDGLGAKQASAMYYQRIYSNNKTSENLYIMVNKCILAKNNQKLAKYLPLLFTCEDYTEIIVKANTYLINNAEKKEDIAIACNEDNRLKCAYLNLLLKNQRNDDAVAFFEETCCTVDLQQPILASFLFCDADLGDLVNTKFQEYFQSFETEYILHRTELDTLLKIKPLYFLITVYTSKADLLSANEKALLAGYRQEYNNLIFLD